MQCCGGFAPAEGSEPADLSLLQFDPGDAGDPEPSADRGAGTADWDEIDIDIDPDAATSLDPRPSTALEPEPQVHELPMAAWSDTPVEAPVEAPVSAPEDYPSEASFLDSSTADESPAAVEAAGAPAPDAALDDGRDDLDDALGSGLTVFEQPLAMDEEPAEEAWKQVGELRVPIELFNIFLGEAEGLSLQLWNGLSTWSAERWQPLPDSLVAHAHALAGSSATVGFDACPSLPASSRPPCCASSSWGGAASAAPNPMRSCSARLPRRCVAVAPVCRRLPAPAERRVPRPAPSAARSVLQRLLDSDAGETVMPDEQYAECSRHTHSLGRPARRGGDGRHRRDRRPRCRPRGPTVGPDVFRDATRHLSRLAGDHRPQPPGRPGCRADRPGAADAPEDGASSGADSAEASSASGGFTTESSLRGGWAPG